MSSPQAMPVTQERSSPNRVLILSGGMAFHLLTLLPSMSRSTTLFAVVLVTASIGRSLSALRAATLSALHVGAAALMW